LRPSPASGGAERDIVADASWSGAAYALGYDGHALVVADEDVRGSFLRRFDPTTVANLSETRLDVRGWITAIAFDPP
jgi:hypothetical protein